MEFTPAAEDVLLKIVQFGGGWVGRPEYASHSRFNAPAAASGISGCFCRQVAIQGQGLIIFHHGPFRVARGLENFSQRFDRIGLAQFLFTFRRSGDSPSK